MNITKSLSVCRGYVDIARRSARPFGVTFGACKTDQPSIDSRSKPRSESAPSTRCSRASTSAPPRAAPWSWRHANSTSRFRAPKATRPRLRNPSEGRVFYSTLDRTCADTSFPINSRGGDA